MSNRGRSRKWDEGLLERKMGSILRIGVGLAAALVAAGGTLYLVHGRGQAADYGRFRGLAPELLRPASVLRAAIELRPLALIQLGLLLLILTPIARVAFSVLAFAKQGDRLFVVLALLVLVILLLSFFGYAP